MDLTAELERLDTAIQQLGDIVRATAGAHEDPESSVHFFDTPQELTDFGVANWLQTPCELKEPMRVIHLKEECRINTAIGGDVVIPAGDYLIEVNNNEGGKSWIQLNAEQMDATYKPVGHNSAFQMLKNEYNQLRNAHQMACRELELLRPIPEMQRQISVRCARYEHEMATAK